jgi:hypothetical protein
MKHFSWSALQIYELTLSMMTSFKPTAGMFGCFAKHSRHIPKIFCSLCYNYASIFLSLTTTQQKISKIVTLQQHAACHLRRVFSGINKISVGTFAIKCKFPVVENPWKTTGRCQNIFSCISLNIK